jgi:hypothetical protein
MTVRTGLAHDRLWDAWRAAVRPPDAVSERLSIKLKR